MDRASILYPRTTPAAGARTRRSIDREGGRHAILGDADLRWLFILCLGSSGFWIVVATLGEGPRALLSSAATALAAGLAFLLVVWRGPTCVLPLLVYLIAIETVIREYALSLPYQTVEYLLIGTAGVAILTRRCGFRWNALFLALYVLIEWIDSFRSGHPDAARAMGVGSAARLAILMLEMRANLGGSAMGPILRAFLVGTGTIAALSAYSLLTGEVVWTTQVNFTASAGMGPNQVGFMLAFGAFVAIVAADLAANLRVRTSLLVLVALQSLGGLLTFTRGAAVALAGSILIYSIVRSWQRRTIVGMVLVLGLLVGTTAMAVTITDSMLVRRFEKKNVSNRDVIVLGGWEIFSAHPFIGIGTGNFYQEAADRRILTSGYRTGAHNEIVRALTEHGIVGGMVYLLFLLTSLAQARRGVTGHARTICLVWLALALLYEIHSGFKLAAQALLLALACEAFRQRRRGPAEVASRDGGRNDDPRKAPA
jgi:O-antigen ligase